MKALTKLRRIAKEHGLKISIKSYSFGRSISILDNDNAPIGNVFFEGSELLERLTSFKNAIPDGLLAEVKEQEDCPYNKISGWNSFKTTNVIPTQQASA